MVRFGGAVMGGNPRGGCSGNRFRVSGSAILLRRKLGVAHRSTGLGKPQGARLKRVDSITISFSVASYCYFLLTPRLASYHLFASASRLFVALASRP